MKSSHMYNQAIAEAANIAVEDVNIILSATFTVWGY